MCDVESRRFGLASRGDFFKITLILPSVIFAPRKSPTLVIVAILASVISGFAQSPTAEPTSEETKSEAGVTPTPESTEDTESLNDWSGVSPDDALFAATRLIPDQVYIHRHDLDGVAVSIFRAELQTRTLVARHDFRGRGISHIEWSPDSKFLLFTTESSGGHQPWHAAAFLFCASDNSFRDVEPAIGTVVSRNFRFEPPDVAIMMVKKGDEREAEVKVTLANTVDHMPIVEGANRRVQRVASSMFPSHWTCTAMLLAISAVAVLGIAVWLLAKRGPIRQRSITAKKAIELAHDTGSDHRNEIKSSFITNAGPEELQKFMYGISAQLNNEYFNWAKIALDVRIARSLSRLTVMLVVLTIILVALTFALVLYAKR
jgi:hypothetical protein